MTSDKRLRTQKLKSWCRACCSALACANQQANKATTYPKQAAWRDANRAQWNTRMAVAGKKRYCAKLKRVPCWYDQGKVQEIYELAAEFREAGFDVDVDHIVPLQAAEASGLHWLRPPAGLPRRPQPKQTQRHAFAPRAFSTPGLNSI